MLFHRLAVRRVEHIGRWDRCLEPSRLVRAAAAFLLTRTTESEESQVEANR